MRWGANDGLPASMAAQRHHNHHQHSHSLQRPTRRSLWVCLVVALVSVAVLLNLYFTPQSALNVFWGQGWSPAVSTNGPASAVHASERALDARSTEAPSASSNPKSDQSGDARGSQGIKHNARGSVSGSGNSRGNAKAGKVDTKNQEAIAGNQQQQLTNGATGKPARAKRLPTLKQPVNNSGLHISKEEASMPSKVLDLAHTSIPHIIHQNYLGGKDALVEAAMERHSHFRREWWMSCQTHNPGWTYMFWDYAACERLLSAQYPWFLDTWRAYPSTVLKSDAVRPFILHAHGGVYLDLDTECFKPLAPSLEGSHLVFMSELRSVVNNAQMASVPAHPFWWSVFPVMQARAKAGVVDPLQATGPDMLTRVLKKHLDLPNGASLPGTHISKQDNTTIRIYGEKEWFTLCQWDDWGCQVAFEQNKPTERRRPKLVGIHRFSGSWLNGADDTKSYNLKLEGISGILKFMGNASAFVEHHCPKTRSSGSRKSFDAHYDVCWDAIQHDINADRCQVVSIRQNSSFDTSFEEGLAAAGCQVHLVSLQNVDMLKKRLPNGTSIVPYEAMLAPMDDPFAFVERHTLESILEVVDKSHNVTVLNIQCHGCEWPVLNQLYVDGSTALKRVTQLLIEFWPLSHRDQHHAHSMYEHLYQQIGFIGYSHKQLGKAARVDLGDSNFVLGSNEEDRTTEKALYVLGFIQAVRLEITNSEIAYLLRK